MLQGKKVDLKLVEKEDAPLLQEWLNDPAFFGEFEPILQITKAEVEKSAERPERPRVFFIQKKDGTRVGLIEVRDAHPGRSDSGSEVGYAILPGERRKGYCSEAAALAVDFTFLTTPVVRVQADTNVRNVGSQKVLERVGFKREGTLRKAHFARGEWMDLYLYSILREEWKWPKVLKG